MPDGAYVPIDDQDNYSPRCCSTWSGREKVMGWSIATLSLLSTILIIILLSQHDSGYIPPNPTQPTEPTTQPTPTTTPVSSTTKITGVPETTDATTTTELPSTTKEPVTTEITTKEPTTNSTTSIETTPETTDVPSSTTKKPEIANVTISGMNIGVLEKPLRFSVNKINYTID